MGHVNANLYSGSVRHPQLLRNRASLSKHILQSSSYITPKLCRGQEDIHISLLTLLQETTWAPYLKSLLQVCT